MDLISLAIALTVFAAMLVAIDLLERGGSHASKGAPGRVEGA